MINRQTFVHEGVEVVKTGRTATRNLPSGKVDIVIEITPADSTIGIWKKWVSENQLYTITGQ